MTGTAIAQLIMFAMMPIVSRLFTPADFGIYGSFSAVLGVLTAVATLQYSQAVVLPKRQADAINLLWVTFLSIIFVVIISAAVISVFPDATQRIINAPNKWFLLLIILAVFVTGFNQSFQAWCIREKAFKSTSLSQIFRSVTAISIWIAAGFWHMGALGLALGIVLADSVASLNLWKVTRKDLKENHAIVTWQRVQKLAREYKDFPLFAAPQHVMNAVSQGLPVLLLGYYYGIGIAGAYAFSIRIIQTPMNLIVNPLRQVLFQKASETHNNNGNLYSLFMKITVGLIAIAFLPCVIIFIWAPSIFSFIFGSEWLEAGVYTRWLILWLFAGFSNVPAVLCARILRQQRNLFLFDSLVLLSRTVVLVLGGMYWSNITTIISFSVAGFVLNTILVIWVGMLLYHNKKIPLQPAV